VSAIDVDCITVPDVAVTMTVVVPMGVPIPVPVVVVLFDPPQPTAATSNPVATAMPTHFGARVMPSRRSAALFRKYRSKRSNATNSKPNGPRRDPGMEATGLNADPKVPVVTVEIVN
jgi:hypothetical protein